MGDRHPKNQVQDSDPLEERRHQTGAPYVFSLMLSNSNQSTNWAAKPAIELLEDVDEEEMKAPILKKRRRISKSKVKEERYSEDEAEESEEEDEISPEFRPSGAREGEKRGFELYWSVETDLYYSLIVLRNPNVKCSVSAPSAQSLRITWTAAPPPDEVLKEVGGGLKAAYIQTGEKAGNIVLLPRSGALQQNQALWTKVVTAEHAVFKIPKVSAITDTTTEF